MKSDERRIQIALTVGDPSGIGPEIILSLLDQPWNGPAGRLLVFAPWKVLRECANKTGRTMQFKRGRIIGGSLETSVVNVGSDAVRWNPGKPDEEGAKAAWEAIDLGIASVKQGECQALVTGPIHKAQMLGIGFPTPGHTEYLAMRTGARETYILYDSPRLRVALVTGHIPLKDVPRLLSQTKIEDLSLHVYRYLKKLAISDPRIAIAGLNPHAGSGDYFGPEEEQVIKPALERLAKMDLHIQGPLPPDTVFLKAIQGEYDAVVALYHDQGSIPVKIVDFLHAVNVTLGLPIIRTSVDHGTAFDIAGTGKASCMNLGEAVKLAIRLASHNPTQSPFTPSGQKESRAVR